METITRLVAAGYCVEFDPWLPQGVLCSIRQFKDNRLLGQGLKNTADEALTMAANSCVDERVRSNGQS